MKSTSTSTCTRCGKVRIVAKTWIEKIVTASGKGNVTHSSTVCPDSDCQKIVEADFAKQKSKYLALKAEKEERLKQALINRHHR